MSLDDEFLKSHLCERILREVEQVVPPKDPVFAHAVLRSVLRRVRSRLHSAEAAIKQLNVIAVATGRFVEGLSPEERASEEHREMSDAVDFFGDELPVEVLLGTGSVEAESVLRRAPEAVSVAAYEGRKNDGSLDDMEAGALLGLGYAHGVGTDSNGDGDWADAAEIMSHFLSLVGEAIRDTQALTD